MLISGRIVVSFVMFAIFAVMVAVASTYPPETRFLPFVIGIPGVLLAAAQLVVDLLAGRRDGREVENDGTGSTGHRLDDRPRAIEDEPIRGPISRRELVMFGYFFGFLATVLLLGFQAATPILVFVYLKLHEREGWALSLGMAAAAGVLIHFMFRVLLELFLFEGFLYLWIFG